MGTQTLELLRWVSAGIRTYDETIAAWKTSCPRLAVWDDAVSDRLVRVVRDPGNGFVVTLTSAGWAAIDGQRADAEVSSPAG